MLVAETAVTSTLSVPVSFALCCVLPETDSAVSVPHPPSQPLCFCSQLLSFLSDPAVTATSLFC